MNPPTASPSTAVDAMQRDMLLQLYNEMSKEERSNLRRSALARFAERLACENGCFVVDRVFMERMPDEVEGLILCFLPLDYLTYYAFLLRDDRIQNLYLQYRAKALNDQAYRENVYVLAFACTMGYSRLVHKLVVDEQWADKVFFRAFGDNAAILTPADVKRCSDLAAGKGGAATFMTFMSSPRFPKTPNMWYSALIEAGKKMHAKRFKKLLNACYLSFVASSATLSCDSEESRRRLRDFRSSYSNMIAAVCERVFELERFGKNWKYLPYFVHMAPDDEKPEFVRQRRIVRSILRALIGHSSYILPGDFDAAEADSAVVASLRHYPACAAIAKHTSSANGLHIHASLSLLNCVRQVHGTRMLPMAEKYMICCMQGLAERTQNPSYKKAVRAMCGVIGTYRHDERAAFRSDRLGESDGVFQYSGEEDTLHLSHADRAGICRFVKHFKRPQVFLRMLIPTMDFAVRATVQNTKIWKSSMAFYVEILQDIVFNVFGGTERLAKLFVKVQKQQPQQRQFIDNAIGELIATLAKDTMRKNRINVSLAVEYIVDTFSVRPFAAESKTVTQLMHNGHALCLDVFKRKGLLLKNDRPMDATEQEVMIEFTRQMRNMMDSQEEAQDRRASEWGSYRDAKSDAGFFGF
jgi:hypothetical protein